MLFPFTTSKISTLLQPTAATSAHFSSNTFYNSLRMLSPSCLHIIINIQFCSIVINSFFSFSVPLHFFLKHFLVYFMILSYFLCAVLMLVIRSFVCSLCFIIPFTLLLTLVCFAATHYIPLTSLALHALLTLFSIHFSFWYWQYLSIHQVLFRNSFCSASIHVHITQSPHHSSAYHDIFHQSSLHHLPPCNFDKLIFIYILLKRCTCYH